MPEATGRARANAATGSASAENKAVKITDETTCSTTEMAMVLGVTARRVQQMIQDGTLITVVRGRLNLADNVQRYIRFLTDGQLTEEEKKIEKARTAAEVKLKVAKADIAQLEAAELKGKMHRSEDVEALTQDYCDTVRNAMMSLPGRLSTEVALCDNAEECSTIIRDVVYSILNELSEYEYDPDKYEERVRNRENMDERPDEEE